MCQVRGWLSHKLLASIPEMLIERFNFSQVIEDQNVQDIRTIRVRSYRCRHILCIGRYESVQAVFGNGDICRQARIMFLQAPVRSQSTRVLATPAVRALAKELRVDISQVGFYSRVFFNILAILSFEI